MSEIVLKYPYSRSSKVIEILMSFAEALVSYISWPDNLS